VGGILRKGVELYLVFTHWEAKGSHQKAHQKHRTLKGVEPSGQEEQVAGVFIHRVHNGKIVESWTYDNSHQITMRGQGESSNA
jgi:SnoaL-like polyketide cyclase